MSDSVSETASNASNILKITRWPIVVLIMFLIWYFFPMVLGEFHGQIPENIESQQEVSKTTTQTDSQIGISRGYNVIYSQDVVFLRLLIEAIKDSPFASGFVLSALFLIILACTPFTKALINNWGEVIRNRRQCEMEEIKHARRCEQEELPTKLNAKKEENDAQRMHEIAIKESDKTLEREKLKKERESENKIIEENTVKRAHEKEMNDAQRQHEKEENEAQRQHENANNEAQRNHELAKQKEKNRHLEVMNKETKENEYDRRQHIQHMSNQGYYIPVKILKKGCIDEQGQQHEIGAEVAARPEVANTWIVNKLARYQARSGD